MLNDDPMDHIKDPTRVMTIVREFIDTHQIIVPETIYQMDSIIEAAYDFIAELCDAAGYAPEIDEDAPEDEDGGDDDAYED